MGDVLEDLVTTAEAGRRLGISRERVRQLSLRVDFPRPLGRIGTAVVWRWTEIEAWWQAREPGKPGRPRKRDE